MKIWPFGKKKETQYAVAKLVDNTVNPDSPEVSPLRNKKMTYIKYLGKLKQSLVSGNQKEMMLWSTYLTSQGIPAPTTLSGCQKQIQEIQGWQ